MEPKKSQRKSERFTLRVSRIERESWERAAELEGRSLGQFVRLAVNRAASGTRQLRRFGESWAGGVNDRP